MIETLLSSSALILALTALRRLLRGRISARLQYALWLLVLIRLLVPMSFFQNPVSVATAAAPAVERVEALSETVLPAPAAAQAEDTAEAPSPARPSEASPAPSPTLGDAMRWIWLGGAVLMACWFLAVNARMALRLRESRRPYPSESSLPVYVAAGLPSPCLFGLFRPSIYLTEKAAEEEARARRIVVHEQTHFRHGDVIWALLRSVCLAVWWFDPLVWLAAVLSRRDGELACDEGAIRVLGEAERFDYGRTLLDMARLEVRPSDLLCGATTMTSGKSTLKARIERIARSKKTSAAAAVLALILAAGAVGCTYGGAARQLTDKAAYGADVFRRYYTRQAETDTRLDYSRMDLELLDAMACPAPAPAVDTEELTIETAGAVVSGSTAEIVLRVTAKQLDTLLREDGDPGPLRNCRFGDETAMMSIYTLDRSFLYLAPGYTYCDTDETLAPNQLYLRYRIVLPESFSAHPYSVPYWIEPAAPEDGELFYITLTDFGYYEQGRLVPLYEGTWNVGIDLTPSSDTAKLVPVEKPIQLEGQPLILESIRVTSLGCTIRLVCPEGEDYVSGHWDALTAAQQEAMRELRENGSILFSDGTRWKMDQLYDVGGGGTAGDYGICLLFPGPTDAEDIASLSLFGSEFDLR